MTVRILLLVAALGIASACAQSTAPTAPTPVQTAAASPGAGAPSQTIAIAGASEAAGTAEAFDPGAVSIRPGASVVFTNDDAVAHSLAADDGSWSSGNIDAEGTFSVTFPKTGTFGYHDTAHPEIRGVVIVQ